MPINIAWGPASIIANTPTPTPALTLDAADNWVQASADFSALPAGHVWTVLIQRRISSGAPWEDNGSATGTTIGGPQHDRQGNVVETNVRASLPSAWAGLTGRQVRAIATLDMAATLSGHVLTGA